MRILTVSDGFTASAAPSAGTNVAAKIRTYASDAAFVSANGAATNGIYYNSAMATLRVYNGSAWVNVDDLRVYANDAAFVSAKGSAAAEGDHYYFNSGVPGTEGLRYYADGAWRTAVSLDQTQTLTNKTLTSPTIASPTITTPTLSTATVNGVKFAVSASKTGTYTALVTDYLIRCDSSGGAFSVNLPAASGNAGLTLVVKKTDSSFNPVTIDGSGSETIDGSTTTTVNTQNEALMIQCDGTNWQIVQRRIPSVYASYTPTFTSFGTVSATECVWRRVGDSVELLIKATAGTVSAAEARVSLPSGLTSAGSPKIASIRLVGNMTSNVAEAPQWMVLAETSVTYVTFGYQASTAGLTKINASGNFSSSGTYAFYCSVPIAGWEG